MRAARAADESVPERADETSNLCRSLEKIILGVPASVVTGLCGKNGFILLLPKVSVFPESGIVQSAGANSNVSQRPLYRELAKLTDEGLMVHLQAGHHDAIAVLFDRYQRLVL
jgi:hypothetical protein